MWLHVKINAQSACNTFVIILINECERTGVIWQKQRTLQDSIAFNVYWWEKVIALKVERVKGAK